MAPISQPSQHKPTTEDWVGTAQVCVLRKPPAVVIGVVLDLDLMPLRRTGSAQRYPSSAEAAAGGVAAAHGMLLARVLVLSRLVPDGVVVPRVVLLVVLADGPWSAAAEVRDLEALLGARHAQQHEQHHQQQPSGPPAGPRGGAH